MSAEAEQITLRSGESGDVDTLIAFNQAHAAEIEGRELAAPVLRRGIEHLLAQPEDGFYLLAELDGQLAGSLMVTREWSEWRAGWFWWIQSVYVQPACRRRGVYAALHNEVRRRAHAADRVIGLRLYVEKDNERAQATYRAHGMTETYYRLFEEEFPAAG